MAREPDITEEEFGRWIRCPDAIERLNAHHKNDAIQQIWLRLQSGLIQAAASAVFIPTDPDNAIRRFIPRGFWKVYPGDIYTSSFWRTGNIDIALKHPGIDEKITNHFIDVRFSPADIVKIPAPQIDKRRDENPPVETLDHAAILRMYGYKMPQEGNGADNPEVHAEAPQGRPLSDALLGKWCRLYLEAYKPEDRSEPLATKSVAGMFPGKSVTRKGFVRHSRNSTRQDREDEKRQSRRIRCQVRRN